MGPVAHALPRWAPTGLKQLWIYSTLQPLFPAFRQVALISLAVNLLALVTPIFILQVYDRVVFYNGISTLQGLTIGVLIALSFDFSLREGRCRLLREVALRIDVEVARQLFRKIIVLPLQELEARPAAHWQALFRDAEITRNAFSGASVVLLADIPFAFLFLALVFLIATPIAWVVLLALPVFALLAWQSGRTVSALSTQERGAGHARDTLLAELVSGRSTVKALDLNETLRPIWEARHAQTIEKALRRGAISDQFMNLGLSLSGFLTVLITTIGAIAIIDQRMTIGALIAGNMLSMRIAGPFNQLVSNWKIYAQASQAMRRLDDVMKMPEERTCMDVVPARPKGALSAKGVTFCYSRDLAPAIQDLDLQLGPTGMHAIVGPNGSGKTTILKLLQGLYAPTSGRLLIDGADLAQFSRNVLARWIGYIPQECFFFAGTIHHNITIGRPGASDADVVTAATLAGLHDSVIDLPDGYSTEVGEAGSKLSGGFRQRLAIARALIGNPPVLLLDEPTSHLDRKREEELCRSFCELARERTVVVVTHSPVLLRSCDMVIALENGRVSFAGRTAEVLPQIFHAPQVETRRKAG